MTTEFSVGAINCRIVSDGTDLYPPEVVFTGVSDADLAAALLGWVNDEGLVYSFYSCMLKGTLRELPSRLDRPDIHLSPQSTRGSHDVRART